MLTRASNEGYPKVPEDFTITEKDFTFKTLFAIKTLGQWTVGEIRVFCPMGVLGVFIQSKYSPNVQCCNV